MARKQRASQSRKKFRRTIPQEVEKRILEHLDDSRVQKTSVLAAELGYSPEVVREACKRLYEKDSLRVSRIPYYVYFFPLTGDVLHRGNYPVVSRLIALSQGALTGGAVSPRLKTIFATLRHNPALKSSPHQSYISRCEQAAIRVGGGAELQERISLRPLRRLATHWWPQSLERQYERPVSRIVERLKKRHIQDVARKLQEVTLEARTQLASNPMVDANKAEKAVHGALQGYAKLASDLEDSGTQELVNKRDSQLASIASLETTPARDLEVVSKGDLENSLDLVHGVPSARREPPEPRVLGMTPRQLVEFILEVAETRATKGGLPPSRGWRKWLLQAVKLGIGGTLVVVDVSLGFGPLVGTLISAGGGEIGIAIAVASSMHTGGKTALDALSEMLKTAPPPATTT